MLFKDLEDKLYKIQNRIMLALSGEKRIVQRAKVPIAKRALYINLPEKF